MPTFDAGSIEGTVDLNVTPFNDALDRVLLRGQEFDDKTFTARAELGGTAEFASELDKLKAKLDEFKAKAASAKAVVNVDRLEFDRLVRDLQIFGAMRYVARVKVDGTAEAIAEVEALKRALAGIRDANADVNVNGGGGGGGLGGMSGIIMGIIMLLPILSTGIMGLVGLLGTLGAAVGIVGVAFGALAIVAMPALQQITKAMSATGKGINSLPPQLREAAKAFQEMKNEISALQAAGGDKVGLALAAAFRTATSILKTLQPIILAAADAFTALMGIADRFFKSSDWRNFSDFVAGNLKGVVVDLGNAIFSLIGALLNLTRAFWDFGGSQIMSMIVKGLQDFDTWTKNLSHNQAFIDFMHEVVLAFPPVMKFIGELIVFIIHLVESLSPLGRMILDNFLNPMLAVINSLPPSVLGPLALGIGAVVLAITGFGGPVSLAVLAIGAVALGLKNLYDNVKPVHDAVDSFVATIREWWMPLWSNLVKMWNENVVPAWDKLAERFKDPAVQGALKNWGDLFTTKVLPAVGQLATVIVRDFIPAVLRLIDVLAPVVAWFVDNVIKAEIDNFSRLIGALGGAFEIASGAIDVFVGWLKGDYKTQVEGGDKIAKGFRDTIASLFGTNDATMQKNMDDFNTNMNKWWDGLWGSNGSLMKTWKEFWDSSSKNWNDEFGANGSVSRTMLDFSTNINKSIRDSTLGPMETSFKTTFDNVGKLSDNIFGTAGKLLISTRDWSTSFGTLIRGGLDTFEGEWQQRVDGFNSSPAHSFFSIISEFAKSQWDSIFGAQGSLTTTLTAWAGDTNVVFNGAATSVQDKVSSFLSNVLGFWVQKFGPQGEVTSSTRQWGDQTNQDINTWLNTNVIGTLTNFLGNAKAGWDKMFSPVGDLLTTTQQWGTETGASFNHWLTEVVAPNVRAFLDTVRGLWDQNFGANGGFTNTLKAFWSVITAGFQNAWNGIQQGAISFVAAISNAFGRIESAFAGPVNWVIDVVINRGLIDMFNSVMGWLGQPDRLQHVATIGGGGLALQGAQQGAQGFAAGGEIPMVPGAMRGKDSVLINAMPGEFMLSTKDVANLGGTAGVEAIRQMAKGYADGGPITASTPNPGLGSILGIATGALNALLNFVGIPGAGAAVSKPPEGAATKAVHAAIASITQKVQAAIAAAAAAAAAVIGGAPGGGAAQWASVILQVLAELGQSPDLLAAVERRINFESGGNPNAINLTDSNAAAGHPSQGLMQTIPSTFAAYAGPYASAGITDPHANIYAGLNYAIHRYGSIAAIDPLNMPSGYDSGGLLKSGMTLAINRSGAPERVLNAEHTSKLDSLLAGGGSMGNADVVDKLDQVRSLLAKNGAGATINIHDISGDPAETARRAIITMRIH